MNFKELKKENKELQDKLNLENSVVDKQLKALEILKERLSLCSRILIGDENSDGLDSFEKDCKEIEDAIKELEELQQSNQDLINTVIEAQKVIKNILECKK